ncbi:MAG: [acyl-carrier-protein] S-malonyltransferase [Alphaproteobacteria bacterium CG_4_10_14_0_8_um_filter_53_9]|nr:MAG: [acyl-carrier-protein] S-malonyltransferase [Alphaproteobacteria bacterium CG_4_10_14_0_8_um_filter_53_9]
MSSSVLWMFPGQGSQGPGMLADFEGHPVTRELLQQAEDTLHQNLIKLMGPDGDEEILRKTENAQPALLTIGYVAAAYLAHQGKDLPAMVAGHSVGEYTAAAVSGCVSFEAALKLVQTRAKAMAAAVPAGQGGMSAVIGLGEEALHTALKGIEGVYVANDNSPGQIILSGTLEGLTQAEEAVKQAGAKRALRLNVSGPFHTPAMHPAAQAVESFLKAHPLQVPKSPLIMNATAKLTENTEEIAHNLVAQITSPVRWRESMEAAAEKGITTCLELGSGKVLTGLASRCDDRLTAHALSTRATIESWLEGRDALNTSS